MSLTEGLVAMTARAIGAVFNLFTSPKNFVYDLSKTAEEQVTENLIGKGYNFHMCYVHEVGLRHKDGWKIAVGRDEFMRPINYCDKRNELILMYRETTVVQDLLNSRSIVSWVLLFMVFAPQMYITRLQWATSTELIFVTVILGLINNTYPIFITHKLRVIDFMMNDEVEKSFSEFSVWGYFWRAFLLLFVSLFATAQFLVLFPRINESSPIISMLQAEFFWILGMTLCAYIFFCKRKMDVFYLLIKSVRGY